MPVSEEHSSFLADLLTKKANAIKSCQEAGVSSKALVDEVDRQIRQCLQGGDILSGKGVTKSGGDD